MRGILKPGKLPGEFLKVLLERYAGADPRVLIGAGIGRDAAVIDFGDRLLVAKADPITFAAEEIGWYAVHINANDVAMTGARPRWFLATLLLPEGRTEEALVDSIFSQIQSACSQLGVVLCGGHTEVTLGLDRPILAGMMLGEVSREDLVRPDGARPGDRLVLSKGIAIEGTCVLAREHPQREEILPPQEMERCRRFLRDPGISVVRDATVACKVARIHALHDPTEGGLATALHEMAEASGVGMRIRREAVPVYPETLRLCSALGLDPLGLLASGSLLMAVDPTDVQTVCEALEREGLHAVEIGEVVPWEEGIHLVEEGRSSPLPVFTQDEVARALGS